MLSGQRRGVEAVAEEGAAIAARAADRIRVGGEAMGREHRALQTGGGGLTAMQRLGHAADIGLDAAGAGSCDGDRLPRRGGVETKQPGAGRGAADRADGAWRMKHEFARFELPGGQAQPLLGLDADGETGQDAFAERLGGGGFLYFHQCEQGRQYRRERVIGRVPHRLEIEHMHRSAVDPGGVRRRDALGTADQACAHRHRLLRRKFGQDRRAPLAGAQRRHGKPIENEVPGGLSRGVVEPAFG